MRVCCQVSLPMCLVFECLGVRVYRCPSTCAYVFVCVVHVLDDVNVHVIVCPVRDGDIACVTVCYRVCTCMFRCM